MGTIELHNPLKKHKLFQQKQLNLKNPSDNWRQVSPTTRSSPPMTAPIKPSELISSVLYNAMPCERFKLSSHSLCCRFRYARSVGRSVSRESPLAPQLGSQGVPRSFKSALSTPHSSQDTRASSLYFVQKEGRARPSSRHPLPRGTPQGPCQLPTEGASKHPAPRVRLVEHGSKDCGWRGFSPCWPCGRVWWPCEGRWTGCPCGSRSFVRRSAS